MDAEQLCFEFIKLYIGCRTNKGKLVGICKDSLFIETENNEMQTFRAETLGNGLFLHLRHLGDLTREEINMVIEKGINIGRPSGYSFSPGALRFLLNLNVDLFGLVIAGYAKTQNENILK